MVSAPEGRLGRLGRYELISQIAKGGMGEVYLARTRGVGGFERLVVVKRALPSLADSTQQMLLAEARLAATLQHTNIVQVHDVDTDGTTVFLAMEYLHGQDMRAVLRRSWGHDRPLPLDQALAVVLSVCAGLHYAHEKRDPEDGQPLEIVHRDVSPSNVFVTYDGGVKLIDFGIAKATTLPSETQLGTVKGKPGYMSPEQCRCEPLDRRSDVFCVGILLYELTTGRRCFAADNEYLIAKRIMEDSPAAFDAAYPRGLAAIALRALAKDRRDRYPTALALQQELAAFANTMRLDVSQFGLVRLMAELFADELAAWHEAQRSGQSLVEHVIKRTTLTVKAISPPVMTAPTRPAKRVASVTPAAAPVRRRWLVPTLAIAAGIAIMIGAIAWRSLTSQPVARPTAPVAVPDAATRAVDAAIAAPAAASPDAAAPEDAAPERVPARKKRHHSTTKPGPPLEDDGDPDSIIR